MKRVVLAVLLAALLISALAFVASAAAQTERYTGPKWEYMTVRVSLNTEGGYTFVASTADEVKSESLTSILSQLGEGTSAQALLSALNFVGYQGWELISPIPIDSGDFLLTFKRVIVIQ